jgi:hypothetical protein
MARRKKRNKPAAPCRDCGLLPETTDWDLTSHPGSWLGGICPTCREKRRRERHNKTGQKLLDKAKVETVVIDGREFVVKKLPPKRRGGR